MTRYQGCTTKFTENMRIPPNDLLVKMLVVKPRLINGKWVPVVAEKLGGISTLT